MTNRQSPEPRARRIALPTRGGEMSVLDFGPEDRAVDIVFSHANGFNSRTYRSLLAPLADDLRILAIDMRGHGLSSLPARPQALVDWYGHRDDLLALIEATTTQPVILSGHSMGGAASLLVAAAAPQRVKALVLFDPVFVDPGMVAANGQTNPLADGAVRRRATFPSRAAVIAAYTGRGAFRTWQPEQLADYVEGGFIEAADGEVTLACAPAWEAANFRTHGYDALVAFQVTTCPIHIFRAEHGSTARLDSYADALAAMGRVTVETVPGTTHFLPMERPDVVRAALARG